jgi:transglutaminase-like putative cysteine protease
MSVRVALHHATRYAYDRRIKLGPQVIRLRPAPHCRTPILSYRLDIQPESHFLNWQSDPQANWLARVLVPEATDHLNVTVDLVAELAVINPLDFFLESSAERFPFGYEPALALELAPYLIIEPVGPDFQNYLATVVRADTPTITFLANLNAKLQNDIAYLIRMEAGVQTPDETLRKQSGSCRDSAWLLVMLLRYLGLAARFASGYLIQLKADVKSLDGPSGASEDFTDLHAWCEVYLPGAGWVGLDPTSGLFAGEGHIPLACAASPTSASPISGTVDPCEVTFGFEMSVTRVHEPARVTKPYTPAQWQAIDALGDRVDEALRAGDVRLTMGGEPTLVAIDDMDGAEWTIDAVGPTKRAYADTLIRRLRDRFAPDGLLHYGQGKWYPGESLPRWTFALYWRGDGLPLWHDAARIAREDADAEPDIEDAEALARGIARRINIEHDYVIPAFEDPEILRKKEEALPDNVTLDDSKIEDPKNARGSNGLSNAASTRPPHSCSRCNAGTRSTRVPGVPRSGRRARAAFTSSWATRPPGCACRSDRYRTSNPKTGPSSPHRIRSASLRPCPMPDEMHQAFIASANAGGARQQQVEQRIAIDGTVRTALLVEPRGGRLCVFMPPTESAADYLELLGAVEAARTNSTRPCTSKGIRRRTIRASTSSRSRPIPA